MKLLNLSYLIVCASSAYVPVPPSASPQAQIQPSSQLPPQFSQPPAMSMQPHVMYTPITNSAPGYAGAPDALLTNMDFLTKMGNLAYGMGVKFAQGMESAHQGQDQIKIDPPQLPQDPQDDGIEQAGQDTEPKAEDSF